MQVFLRNADKLLEDCLEDVNPKPEEPVKASSMLVVLAKNVSNVRSTVNFLERRGFAAKVANSLNEAVELFSRKEANMLLLSANFPHPKVEMLPVLMNQSFQIETILYAEDSDRKSSAKLNNAKTRHVLFGPVSGPVVMMKIRQIEREMNGEEDEGDASNSSRVTSSKEESGDIKVGGRKASGDDTVVLNGKTDTDKKAALDHLMKSLVDDDETEEQASTSLARSGDTYVAKGERSKMKSSDGSVDGDDDENGLLSENAQNLRAALDRGLQEAPVGQRARLIMPNSIPRTAAKRNRPAVDGDQVAAEADAELDASLADREEAAQRAHAEVAERAKNEREDQISLEAAQREEKLKQSAEKSKSSLDKKPAAGKVKAAKAEQARELTEAEKVAPSIEEKIHLCLREALAIVAGAPTEDVQRLEKYASAALVTLRTTQLNCAFVVSLNYAKQTPVELFHRMEIAFFSLLRDYGVEFENHQTYSIFLDNMNRVNEAFAGSEYSVVTQTNEIEMGAARVFVNNPVAKTEPYQENMLSINLRDLPLDVPVTFSLFLHFQRNNKYVRYLKKGSSISGKQIGRLEKHRVQGLVDQEEAEAYQRHFAAYSIVDSKKRAA